MKLNGSLLAAVGAAALSACGGDDSGGSPPPTEGGTPTPSPTFSYTKFADLEGDQDYPVACVVAQGSAIGTIEGAFPLLAGTRGAILFEDATDTWTVNNFSVTEDMFGPADLVEQTEFYDQYLSDTPLGIPNRLRVIRNNDTGLDFEYMRSSFSLMFAGGLPPGYRICNFGVATDPEDVPDAASVTWTDLRFGGFVIDATPGGPNPSEASSIVGGSGTMTGNTSTGDMTIDISLTVEDPRGVQTVITPIRGTVSFETDGTAAGYSGLLNFGGTPEYLVSGGYFGPQGRETGFAFHAAIDQDFDGIPERSIFGGVAAKR